MKKIEHIGIAVKSIEEANKTFAKIFGKEHYKIEEVKSEGVKTSFFSVGESKIELLEAKNQESPIAKFISKRGEGMHHIAFYVDDIEKERIDGYEHRASKKRKPSIDNTDSPGKCLLAMSDDSS